MKTIIGIVGVKTSGKSTTAQMIREFIKREQINEVALADKLKNVCAEVFDLPRLIFDDQRYKEVPFELFRIQKKLKSYRITEILKAFGYDGVRVYDKFEHLIDMKLESARHIAQIVGTQVLRAMGDEDIHCKQISLNFPITIISDIRFPNEYKYFSNLESYRFIPLYIHRKSVEALVDLKTSHESETSVFKFRDQCRWLDNNGTLLDLEREVQEVIEEEYYGQ